MRFFPPGWKPRLYGRQDARRYSPIRAKRCSGAKQERLDNWHTLQELAGII